MDAPAGKPAEASIGELFGRVGDEGRAFVRAEIGLLTAIARHRIAASRNGAIAIVAGILLINAALIALVVSIALELALRVGPLLGGAITFVGVGLVAGLLLWWGAGRLRALGGDAEERAAAFIADNVSKPVVGYVAGFTAPEGKTMGHAGAIVSGSSGTAAAKKEALEAVGVKVGKTPSETARLLRAAIG